MSGEVIPLRPDASDIHYEVALDEEPLPAAAVPVDAAPVVADRLPIIPEWMRPEQVRFSARRLAYSTGAHTLRSPMYLALTMAWGIVGIFKLIARQLHWWWLLEAQGLKSQAAADGDSREWKSLHRVAQQTRKTRGIALSIEVGLLLIAGVLLAHYGRWWAWALAVAVVLPFLARHGRPADKPIIKPVVVTPRFRRLSADIVLRAYYAARLGDPVKPDLQITFGSAMRRDGEGSRVLVDLPYGKSLKDAMLVKDAIASGLDVTETQVYLHRDPTSARRHTLWVADRDPLAVPVGRTPLLACRQTDIWQPAPIGLDERGQIVKVPVLWHSVLVGSIPRMGKTFTARLLGLYAALDPYVRLDVFDAAGKPDWRKFALVADSCGYGLIPTREGKPAEILLATLESIKSDVQDRYERLSGMPLSICPEGKLTREIARDPRYDMPVRVLVIDEFQEYYELGDISKAIADLLRFIVKVAPAAGVSVIGATQKPAGIGGVGQLGSMFTATRDNFLVRFALKTASYSVSESVLGQGTLGMGLDSSKLLAEYKGVGILHNASDKSPTVRTYMADGQDAEKILTVARAIRERAGTLSGMALGETGPAAVSVLADVLAVLGEQTGYPWEVLAPLLARRFPDRHADATAESVSAQCRAAGVASVDVKYMGRALKGCRRADVMAAVKQAGDR